MSSLVVNDFETIVHGMIFEFEVLKIFIYAPFIFAHYLEGSWNI